MGVLVLLYDLVVIGVDDVNMMVRLLDNGQWVGKGNDTVKFESG